METKVPPIIENSKLPKGVFNLINGDGAVAGNALTSHPDVNMVSFTGSTRAGALISQNAASDFKRISLELGGKGANIIFKDADGSFLQGIGIDFSKDFKIVNKKYFNY